MGVRIARHTGEVNTIPSDARNIPRHRPNLALGKALSGVGSAISAVADHRAKRKEQMENFKAANNLRAFSSNLEAAREEAVRGAEEGGAGLTEGFMGPGGQYEAEVAKLRALSGNSKIDEQVAIITGEGGSVRAVANNAIAKDELLLQHQFIDANIGDASDETSNSIFTRAGTFYGRAGTP